MDANGARNLGLIGGGGALLVALAVAFIGDQGGTDRPPVADPPVVAGTVSAAPSVAASAPIPAPQVETAMADGPPSRPVSIPQAPKAAPAADAPPINPNLEFIVRFDDRHPLSRAQALYLQGKYAEAEAAARETLARRTEFSGLCFTRFTLGAELVLAHCTRVSRAQMQRTSDRWVRRLKAMTGVQYADANVIVAPEGK